MDKPEILEIILQQLPLRTQLACTLVSREWHHAARGLLQRYQLARFECQLDSLRCFTLNKSTTAATTSFFHSLPLLSHLVSLTISPDAQIAPDEINKRTGQHDPTQLCLARLFPQLDKLRHLYIHGQDLRCKSHGSDSKGHQGGTDAALLSFAASRRDKNLPGLQTLSIVSSPDLTDAGLIGYLGTILSDLQDPSPSETYDYTGRYTLGSSLISLTFVNCPHLTFNSLQALEQHCKHLTQLTLRDVDGLFTALSSEGSNGLEEVSDPQHAFNNFLRNNVNLHTFTFSSSLPSLPPDFFSAFNSPRNALQNLHLQPSKAIRGHHLMNFPSIHRLTITGCSNLGDELPFEYLPRLQELSFLGRGLSLSSLWKLFEQGTIRKVTLDVAGSAYETCICSERASIKDDNGEDSPQAHSKQGEMKQRADLIFPPLLHNFEKHNILSSTIPSWVIAFFLSLSPASLESISLHGAIVPTCCSIRSSPPPPSLSSSPQVSYHAHQPFSFTYFNLLRPSLDSIPALGPIFRFVPSLIFKALFGNSSQSSNQSASNARNATPIILNDTSAATALARLSFRALQGLAAGSSSTCPLPEVSDEGTMYDADKTDSWISQETDSAASSDSELSAGETNIESADREDGSTPTLARRAGSNRRQRAQSVSGVPSRKAKVARRALQRSASEFQSGRSEQKTSSSCSGSDKLSDKRSRGRSFWRAAPPEDTSGSSIDVSRARGSTSGPDADSAKLSTSSVQSAKDAAEDARRAALAELLALSTIDSTTPPPTYSHFGNAGTSRLNSQQVEWLHSATQGRLVRLEL